MAENNALNCLIVLKLLAYPTVINRFDDYGRKILFYVAHNKKEWKNLTTPVGHLHMRMELIPYHIVVMYIISNILYIL